MRIHNHKPYTSSDIATPTHQMSWARPVWSARLIHLPSVTLWCSLPLMNTESRPEMLFGSRLQRNHSPGHHHTIQHHTKPTSQYLSWQDATFSKHDHNIYTYTSGRDATYGQPYNTWYINIHLHTILQIPLYPTHFYILRLDIYEYEHIHLHYRSSTLPQNVTTAMAGNT